MCRAVSAVRASGQRHNSVGRLARLPARWTECELPTALGNADQPTALGQLSLFVIALPRTRSGMVTLKH